MFQIINDVTCIDGSSGIYDNKIRNDNVRYARNAVRNYIDTYSVQSLENNSKKRKMPKEPKLPKLRKNDTFINRLLNKISLHSLMRKTKKYLNSIDSYLNQTDKELDNLPTSKFNLKYANAKDGYINPIAPVAAAYEEMGKKLSISVSDLTNTLKNTVSPNLSHLVSAKSLDLNKDGNVDVAEYASSILVEDMISTNPTGNLKPTDVNGIISNYGQNALLSFANKNNYKSSFNIFSSVYSSFGLKQAAEEFTRDKNNMI